MAKQAKLSRSNVAKTSKPRRKMRVIPEAPPGTGRITNEMIERWLSKLPRARELARVKG